MIAILTVTLNTPSLTHLSLRLFSFIDFLTFVCVCDFVREQLRETCVLLTKMKAQEETQHTTRTYS